MLLLRISGVCLIALIISACAPSSPPSRFYLLEPGQFDKHAKMPTRSPVTIIIESVKLAEYLNRPQIVTAVAENQYHFSETNRWAEALEDNIQRIVQLNLHQLLPFPVATTSTGLGDNVAIYYLNLKITDSYMNREGQVKVNVFWRLYSQNGSGEVAQSFQCKRQAASNDYPGMVFAMNQCVNELTTQLADEIKVFKTQRSD